MVSDLTPLAGLPLRYLHLDNTAVTDLTPLQGMRLELLNASYTKVGSLEPIKGMPLRFLWLDHCTEVSDLRPFHGMSLTNFLVTDSRVRDFSPLQGLPLQSLSLARNKISNLAFLAGSTVRDLTLQDNPITDLTPLHGLPLVSLSIPATSVRDLSPLIGAPLKQLVMNHCPNTTDLAPLLKIQSLERLQISKGNPMLSVLRNHPGIQTIQLYTGTEGSNRPVAEFWAEYDALKKWSGVRRQSVAPTPLWQERSDAAGAPGAARTSPPRRSAPFQKRRRRCVRLGKR